MGMMDLFRPKWKHTDPDVRKAAIKGLDDQEVLVGIARSDESENVRKAAVGKIEDRGIVAEIAKSDKNWRVRESALKRLEDQEVLAEIANNDEDEDVCQAAVEKLEDQALLADIATNAEAWKVRRGATHRVMDQSILADIARNDEDIDVRTAAVEELEDQELLAGLTKKDVSCWKVRLLAVGALGRMGLADSTDIQQIVTLLEEPDKRCDAANVLGEIGGDIAKEALKRELELHQEKIAKAEASVSVGDLFGGRSFSGTGIAGQIASMASASMVSGAQDAKRQLAELEPYVAALEQSISKLES